MHSSLEGIWGTTGKSECGPFVTYNNAIKFTIIGCDCGARSPQSQEMHGQSLRVKYHHLSKLFSNGSGKCYYIYTDADKWGERDTASGQNVTNQRTQSLSYHSPSLLI